MRAAVNQRLALTRAIPEIEASRAVKCFDETPFPDLRSAGRRPESLSLCLSLASAVVIAMYRIY